MEDNKVIIERLDNLRITVKEFIEEIKSWKEDHTEEHRQMWIELAGLRVKSGFWGLIGGFFVLIVAILTGIVTGVFAK